MYEVLRYFLELPLHPSCTPAPALKRHRPGGAVTGWLMSCSAHAPQTGPTFSPNEPSSPPRAALRDHGWA
jgi:hypothetical protein